MADEVTAVSACIGAEKPEKNLTSNMAKQMLLAVILVMAVTAMRVVSGDRIWCTNPDDYEGRSYCDHWGGYCGQCVSFVKRCTGSTATTRQWRRGPLVRDTEDYPGRPAYGTAIATFPGGRYSGHAAIYVDQDEDGMWVYDQWSGVNVARRFIRWNGGSLVRSGNNYYIIEV